MPYITQEERGPMDASIIHLIEQIETPGQLNYALSKIAFGVAFAEDDPGYAIFNSVDGVLGLVQFEFRRRVIAPYEDAKIETNGDLFSEPEDEYDPR